MTPPRRPCVLWFGPEPGAAVKQNFQERELSLSYHGLESVPNINDWAFASGLVLKVQENKLGIFLRTWKALVVPALDHGLKVVVEGSEGAIKTLYANLEISPLLKRKIKFLTEQGSYQVPELIARHVELSGPNYSADCTVLPEEIELSNTHRIFLQRAFSDCSEIYLKELTSGKSAKVYCVYATLNQMNGIGIRSLPFFAKFDKREKIQKERIKYNTHASPFIPFNLRPNLDDRRCIEGAFSSLLVGNFVENSESLRDLVQRSGAHAAIQSLFDNTLRAWRQDLINQQLEVPATIGEINAGGLRQANWRRLESRHQTASRYGQVLSPHNLMTAINSLPPLRRRNVRIHGDLHAENVRVRNNEAILIDFASADWGPPTRDPASLEACLVFSQWPDNICFDQWRSIVDVLFQSESFKSRLRPKHEPETGCAVWNYVRQIRAFAFAEQAEWQEYPSSLVYCLFFYSTHKAENENDEARRTYAYYLSSQLINMLTPEKMIAAA